MKGKTKMRYLVIIIIALMSYPVMASRNLAQPLINEPIKIFTAYQGTGGDGITSVPGILKITPGENWSNFVSASQYEIPYFIKNVVLRKTVPQIGQGADVFPPKALAQQGTPNIRLWWPLMYEVPGTTWTLTIVYGTPVPWSNPANPSAPSYIHTEIWQWEMDITLQGLKNVFAMFRQLPFGISQVPLISDESLYPALLQKLDNVTAHLITGNTVDASMLLVDIEMEIMDSCIGVMPQRPNPTGPGTGIAQTFENPACVKLLVDIEHIGFKYNIYQPLK